MLCWEPEVSRMHLLFRPGDDQSLPHLLITLVSAGPGPSGARRPLSSGSRLEEALDELLNPLNTNSIEFTMTASMLFPCVSTRYCARTPRHPTGKGQKENQLVVMFLRVYQGTLNPCLLKKAIWTVVYSIKYKQNTLVFCRRNQEVGHKVTKRAVSSNQEISLEICKSC